MASVPFASGTDRGEARFIFTMACLMAATIVAGFSFDIVTGRSSFSLPWVVHFHAWATMGWLGLYLVQNALIFGNNAALHRRLMFCAFAPLTGPGLGRLPPMPLFIPYAWHVAVFGPLLFIAVGMVADKRRHGRVHPVWGWGAGIVVAMQVLAGLLAYSPTGYRFTEWFLAGTPGAARQMAAFFPPL